MEELNPKDVLRTPSQLKYFIFINTLVYEKKASFSDFNQKAVLLNGDSSNYFLLGRDNKMVPFIAVQDGMTPWFFELTWRRLCICYKEKYVYLVGEEKEGDDSKNHRISYILGLKPRFKRMITLYDPDNENIENMFLNLKLFQINKKEIAVSKSNPISNIKIEVINSLSDIVEKQDKKFTNDDEKNNGDDFVFI
jgi:hypothetical protein